MLQQFVLHGIKDGQLFQRLTTSYALYPEMSTFLRTPFELTLLLYLLSSEPSDGQTRLLNSYELYASFYQHWLVRERKRGTARNRSEIISKSHRQIAIRLYRARGVELTLGDALSSVTTKRVLGLSKDSSFMGLLVTRRLEESGDICIRKFWHETIGEFLAAEDLFTAFLQGGSLVKDVLRTTFHDDVNRFVRGAFTSCSEEQRQQVLHSLEKSYIDLFPARHHSELRSLIQRSISRTVRRRVVPSSAINRTEEATRLREQIIYYIGRLGASTLPGALVFAYFNEPRALLRRSAGLGAILHGDDHIEGEYLSRLTPESIEDVDNRSVQLVYFGDVRADMHSYRDDGQVGWDRTRQAILERLRQSSPRELQLRLWDLRTLYLFFKSRNWRPTPSREELEIINSTVIAVPLLSRERQKALLAEKNRLYRNLRPLTSRR